MTSKSLSNGTVPDLNVLNVLPEPPNSSPPTFLSVAPEPGVHSVVAVNATLSESSFAALICLTDEKS